MLIAEKINGVNLLWREPTGAESEPGTFKGLRVKESEDTDWFKKKATRTRLPNPRLQPDRPRFTISDR